MDLSQRRQLPLFSIGIVQKLTGLSARQIRYYEQHELVQPARTEGNQRLFSLNDVENLMLVRSLLDDGLNMAEIRKRFERHQRIGHGNNENEPTDAEVYEWMRQEMLESPSPNNNSLFQGDLFRLYRRNL
ncbi:MerR family transcriptional regulator [Alicyclobacillus sp. SO9]|uniref:MerR family transcriptional regulator n=1 Tax=Alicyclobacillus sp. SO9 TaxID=2665646 RepID=UPI001E558986|nr:MerR family transcriptional regulator [Alicyclobacillus sp. SO9]